MTEHGDETPGEGAGAGDGDLLAKNGADADFKRVPGTRHPKTGAGEDEGLEERIEREGRVDDVEVGGDVEEAADAAEDIEPLAGGGTNDGDEQVRRGEADGDFDAGPPAAVLGVVDLFEAGDGAGAEEGQDAGPIEGFTDGEAEGGGGTVDFAEGAGGAAIERVDYRMETAYAAEAGGKGDVSKGERGFVDEALGELHAEGLRDADGRSAEVFDEESAEMAAGDAEAVGEGFHAAGIEGSGFDEAETAGDGLGGAEPGRGAGGCLWAAAETGTEAGFFGGIGRGVVDDVGFLRRGRWADGSAVDAGGGDGDEDFAVKAGVASAADLLAEERIERHLPHDTGFRAA